MKQCVAMCAAIIHPVLLNIFHGSVWPCKHFGRLLVPMAFDDLVTIQLSAGGSATTQINRQTTRILATALCRLTKLAQLTVI